MIYINRNRSNYTTENQKEKKRPVLILILKGIHRKDSNKHPASFNRPS